MKARKTFMSILIFGVIGSCICMYDSEKDKKLEAFEVYQKNYDFLFRRCPEEDRQVLFQLLYEPKKDAYKYLKTFWPFIDESKNFFKLGGSVEDLEKKDKKYLEDKVFDVKKIRTNLLEMLIHLIERQEDFSSRFFEKSNYFGTKLVSTGEKIMTGVRGDSSHETCKVTIKNLFKIDEKNQDAFKKRLVGYYKIHLMPKENDILNVTKMLMQELKKDKELGLLIGKFKIKSDLSLEYQQGDKNLPYALIVIYPAEGKDKTQKLLNKLLVLYKKIQGLNKAPRYNLKVNDLIFYAQSDADAKRPHRNGEESEYLKYFDKNKNYALYKNDFEDKPHESYELTF